MITATITHLTSNFPTSRVSVQIAEKVLSAVFRTNNNPTFTFLELLSPCICPFFPYIKLRHHFKTEENFRIEKRKTFTARNILIIMKWVDLLWNDFCRTHSSWLTHILSELQKYFLFLTVREQRSWERILRYVMTCAAAVLEEKKKSRNFTKLRNWPWAIAWEKVS